jgi:hypothetical protein
LWEAEVKVFKTHLYRTLQDRNFTIEELNTCVVVIEGIINSRPLGPLFCDPKGFEPLTAGHFLTGFNGFSVDRFMANIKFYTMG